jgi:Asp-tRNA(Asn)/Glu-tRNA(Gln) amidotransferase A subunit family amidase
LPVTWGIPGTETLPVTDESVPVARLKAAGAIVLGKTNVPFMLADWQSANRIYGGSTGPGSTTSCWSCETSASRRSSSLPSRDASAPPSRIT